jgi:hypothetical protein
MGFREHKLTHPAFLVDGQITAQGNDVVVAGGQTTNYPATGGKQLAPGTVVVKESGDGLYYLADGADGVNAGDLNTAAVVNSAEAADGDWKSKTITWTVTYPDGLVAAGTIAAGGDDDDTAKFVTLLNADVNFRNHLIASDETVLRVTSLVKGNVRVHVTSNLSTAYGANGVQATGVEADYRVVAQHGSLVDLSGASRDSDPVATLLRGKFRTDELRNLSNEARAVLLGRGSLFE